MVRVVLPVHLWTLARSGAEVDVDVSGVVTPASVLEALEAKYPVLRGTIRDMHNGKRRPLVRFFACQQDVSHEPMETPLPGPIVEGKEPLYIIGAIAGG